MSTFQFMHFAWQNPIYFHATSTLSRLSSNHCVTRVKCGFATSENLPCTEIDKVLAYQINIQGIDSLHALNTLSNLRTQEVMKNTEQTHTQHAHMWVEDSGIDKCYIGILR